VWNEGDPGRRRRRGFFSRFKPPRFARRLAGKLTPFARFIPGVGTVLDTVENARSLIPAGDGGFYYADDDEQGDPWDDEMYDEGDPGPKPRRGSAKRGGGGKGKRGGKRGGRSRGRKRGGPGFGEAAGKFLGGLSGAALEQVGPLGTFLGKQTGLIPGEAEGAVPVLPGVTPIAGGGGEMPMLGAPGKHGRGTAPRRMVHRKVDAWTAKSTRSMNPGNTRALRRSLRRVEAFERIVKRMERAYPRLKRAHGVHHAPVHHKKGR
jgi:hypothetical protein